MQLYIETKLSHATVSFNMYMYTRNATFLFPKRMDYIFIHAKFDYTDPKKVKDSRDCVRSAQHVTKLNGVGVLYGYNFYPHLASNQHLPPFAPSESFSNCHMVLSLAPSEPGAKRGVGSRGGCTAAGRCWFLFC